MITRERIAELKRNLIPTSCPVTIAEDELIDLLDAAESALELRKHLEEAQQQRDVAKDHEAHFRNTADNLRAKLDEAIAWIESEQAAMSDQAFEASKLLLARLK